jgi:hypothetical protein
MALGLIKTRSPYGQVRSSQTHSAMLQQAEVMETRPSYITPSEITRSRGGEAFRYEQPQSQGNNGEVA